MRFTKIILAILGLQVSSCVGINGNENSTEEIIGIRFNDTDRYEDESEEAEILERTFVYNETEILEVGEEDDKFVSAPADITLEHIDFVLLRLKHISQKTTSNITELRLAQQEEFEMNEVYQVGWDKAAKTFNDSKRAELFKYFSNDSIVAKVPDEYHIALMAYSLEYPNPALYSDFNRQTRAVCSGKDIDTYYYKTYFKFLILAIETLGQEERFRSGRRFLYRGVGRSSFSLEVGQILAFQHFLSTSASLKIAEKFSQNTLFEVQGKYDTAISIKDHSEYTGEEEFLFSPFQVYEVESKHEGTHYTRYVLIAHKLPKTGGCLDDSSKTSSNEFININSMTTTGSNYLRSGVANPSALGSMRFSFFNYALGALIVKFFGSVVFFENSI